ncbi:hypothetical protein E8E13_002294 [Curvularia kusanoi]|uniref:Uncharacterized protein n=1 Tax=Curvularia kusanoi TaxID=90978 RepID=A0A9P4TIL9_CURKU|nr:hypothetical protein E8E13_002294 [Curvularia kusanoi]
MGHPSIHCVVCGGPFGNPYDELMEGRYPDAGHLQDIKSQELEWLDGVQLFGLPSALQSFYSSASDHQPKSDPKEMPIFIDNARYNYGAEIVFNVRGIGDLATLCPNQNGDCLFAMHGACASIVRLVCARQTTFTLRAYYEVLRSAIPYYYDSGGIYWPHDYFGAQTYWGYDEWDYHEGFRKFVTDPLAISETTNFVLETLEAAPAPPPTSADATGTGRLTQAVETTRAALPNK